MEYPSSSYCPCRIYWIFQDSCAASHVIFDLHIMYDCMYVCMHVCMYCLLYVCGLVYQLGYINFSYDFCNYLYLIVITKNTFPTDLATSQVNQHASTQGFALHFRLKQVNLCVIIWLTLHLLVYGDQGVPGRFHLHESILSRSLFYGQYSNFSWDFFNCYPSVTLIQH